MKKQLAIKIIPAVIAALFASQSVFAISEQTGDFTAETNGIIAGGKKPAQVTISVYAPSKSYQDLKNSKNEERLNVIVYQNQIETGENGEYRFCYSMADRVSGVYTVYLSSAGPETPATEPLFFVNREENKAALEALNQAALISDSNARMEKLTCLTREKKYALGFYSAAEPLAKEQGVLALLDAKLAAAPFDTEDLEGAGRQLKKLFVIDALNRETMDNIFSYPEDAGLADGDLADWYTKPFVGEDIQKRMTARLRGKGFTDLAGYDNEQKAAFLLAVAEHPDGYGNLRDVLNAFSEWLGIEKNGKDSTYRGLANKSYPSLQALKDAFAALEKDGQSSGSASGAGGSPSRGSGKSAATLPPVTPLKTQPLPYDIFTDIRSWEWAREAIVKLAQQGIVSGKAEGLFYPADSVTREEFTKMIVQAFLRDEESSAADFADVEQEAWYAPYIGKAFRAGLVTGMGDGRFGVGEFISRQDMAVMVYRALRMEAMAEKQLDDSAFADDSALSDYAKPCVYRLKEEGILDGMEDGSFHPVETATRAQAAQIIYRAFMY